MNFRKYVVLAVVVFFGALGDVSLKRGMRDAGAIHASQLFDAIRAVANPWILLGIGLLLVFFAAYLTALSWADLTYVLPAASFGYVVMALLGQFWLGEQVGARRWIGIALVVAAVGFVTRGPALSPRRESAPECESLVGEAAGEN